ncbi:acyltransferase [Lysinibacter sp. HNR]|uniref:acyltransferase family protein n=1 Tax=Lysinibacter sp. HNR TaxID=3031408 RepID=UPI0024361016|nr:acyltransferase [Lysinibacter sp. HNR]WGD37159.1 acyltransferase [Lysinibacter sp. HNR]
MTPSSQSDPSAPGTPLPKAQASSVKQAGSARPTRPGASTRPVSDIVQRAQQSGRDLVIDAARVFCLVLVVILHTLMVGLYYSHGEIAQINPLEREAWFPLASWVGQIMPLFFVVGGFAGITSWRRAEASGDTPTRYLRRRLIRVLRPTIPLLLFLTTVFWAAYLAGVPRKLVDLTALGAGLPLWFLAAYILTQAFLPLTARLHSRHPVVLFLSLCLAAILVDTARFTSGFVELGLPNLLFVWLAVQQLGFFYADGQFRERSRGVLVAVILVVYGVITALTFGTGIYPVDMLRNLNPATVPLILLGIAQICLLQLLYPAVSRLMRIGAVVAACVLVGSRAMTIYLWHLPIIIALAGSGFLLGIDTTTPGSGLWWATRPILLVTAGIVVLGVSWILRRWETPPARLPGSHTARQAVWLATILSTAVFVAQIQWGLSLALTPVALGVVTLSYFLVVPPRLQKGIS